MDDRQLLESGTTPSDAAIARIESEFRQGFMLVSKIDRPAVSVFGSARMHPDDPDYAKAMEVGAAFARAGWAVITGGGPGAMEAANRGAQESGGLSVGLGIDLPHEQELNRWLDLSYEFEHFYARKVCFVKPSEGFVVLPGGFGTLDEMFEAVTLIQTVKVAMFPVVLIDSGYWRGLIDWLRDPVLATGKISPADLDLLQVVDDPDEAVRIVLEQYARKTG
jgi:uncharacterized protein (TIGR00730 family)